MTVKPPASGTGAECILRWPGSSTWPVRMHHLRHSANDDPLAISADGQLNQNDQPVAALGLFEADLSAGFVRAGNSGIIPAVQAEPVIDRVDAGVIQGYVEESNVNAIGEMTQLSTVTRAFEAMTSLIRDSETALSEAVKTLGGSR